MQSTKNKITQAVQEYAKLFPTEYETFLKSVRVKNDTRSDEWAELKKTDFVSRHLFDIPETLYFIFQQHLTQEQRDWLYGKNQYQKNREGIKWFMKTFPQFKITKDF